MEPSVDAYDNSLKAGNIILNRFCIDEEAAFELSGVSYLKKSSRAIEWEHEFEVERKFKGKDWIYSYDLRPTLIEKLYIT